MKPFTPSDDTLKMKAFFEQAPMDGNINYSEIETATGVIMNNRGKRLMRSALKTLGKYYICYRNKGIQMEGIKTSLPIVSEKANRTWSSLKNTSKATERIFERYSPQLSQEDRERIGLAASLAGAMLATGRSLTDIYKKPKPVNSEIKEISIPKVKF